MEFIIGGIGIFLIWKVISVVFTLAGLSPEEVAVHKEVYEKRKKARSTEDDDDELFSSRENFESDMRRSSEMFSDTSSYSMDDSSSSFSDSFSDSTDTFNN